MLELITHTGHAMSAANFISLMRSILTDGRINGCGIRYSGANLVVDSGRMIAGGALVTFTNSTSVQASTGGELVLRINTSGDGTATLIARSATTLTQQDLTMTGNTYELQLATFSFSSGAVSGFSVTVPSAKPIGPKFYYGTGEPSASLGVDGDIYFKIVN